jgi:hypothetical protein
MHHEQSAKLAEKSKAKKKTPTRKVHAPPNGNAPAMNLRKDARRGS